MSGLQALGHQLDSRLLLARCWKADCVSALKDCTVVDVCSQLQGTLQVHGCGPSVLEPVPEDPLGGMSMVTGDAWTLCMLLTITVNHGLIFD